MKFTPVRTTSKATTSHCFRLPTRRSANRDGDLLRLAFSRSVAPTRGKRRGSFNPRFGLYGSVERDRADGLVDDYKPRPRHRKHGVCRCRQPSRKSENYPPYSWSGGSQIVDFEGRLLADASPVRENESSSRRLIFPRSVTNAKYGADIIRSRIFAQALIQFTENTFTRQVHEIQLKS